MGILALASTVVSAAGKITEKNFKAQVNSVEKEFKSQSKEGRFFERPIDSIARKAKKNIMFFPVVVSDSISINVASNVARALQIRNAEYMRVAISNLDPVSSKRELTDAIRGSTLKDDLFNFTESTSEVSPISRFIKENSENIAELGLQDRFNPPLEKLIVKESVGDEFDDDITTQSGGSIGSQGEPDELSAATQGGSLENNELPKSRISKEELEAALNDPDAQNYVQDVVANPEKYANDKGRYDNGNFSEGKSGTQTTDTPKIGGGSNKQSRSGNSNGGSNNGNSNGNKNNRNSNGNKNNRNSNGNKNNQNNSTNRNSKNRVTNGNKKNIDRELLKKIDKINSRLPPNAVVDAHHKINLSNLNVASNFEKINRFPPLILDLTLAIKTDTGGFANSHLTLGVKNVIHQIPSLDMVTGLGTALQRDSLFFQFLRCTSGETSFVKDFIFDVNTAKRRAGKDSTKGMNALETLRRQSEWNNARQASVTKLVSNRNFVPPTSTLVISSEDVEYIKAYYKVDFTKPRVVREILNSHNLIGFCIVNENAKAVYIFEDGDDEFDIVSFEEVSRKSGTSELKDVISILSRT
jgi:hypothetical protein